VGGSITWFLARSGNIGSSSEIALKILGGCAAERLLGSYLYPTLHSFFPHLLLPFTLHFPLPLSLSSIPRSRWRATTHNIGPRRWTVPQRRSVAGRTIGFSQGGAASYVLAASQWGASTLAMPSLGLKPPVGAEGAASGGAGAHPCGGDRHRGEGECPPPSAG
jgi:hypothetical protein